MQFTRKYNLINNITGWGVFVIALLTYWLTLEPTVSYWDCGEFITQADKLEIGHPPGNPIFMLTARFFSNFAFGDASKVALMVNAMSGLLSALTILLLFWTITHLAGKLLLTNESAKNMSLAQYLPVMGSGVVGALAYTWSDTFWFSAVEGEVYAFSSFCTALVFWLILKWENRADDPHSDRYLILIAYVIGVSIAVHLLNLLCIPAIVLVFTYRKWKNVNAKRSLLALLVGFAIIVFVLYGLVPGFINVAGWFDIKIVNWLSMPFNSGTIVYALLMVASFIWGLTELHLQRSLARIRLSFCISVLLSGMLFIAGNLWIGIILSIGLFVVMYVVFKENMPLRWLNIILWSISVIFVGYSSYALILIRAHANPPLNQSQADNVLNLSGYLNREQYGETPLLYGPTYQTPYHYMVEGYSDLPIGNGAVVYDAPAYKPILQKGKERICKGVKGAQTYSPLGYLSGKEQKENRSLASGGGDYYVLADYESSMENAKNMDMFLPRIHSRVPGHRSEYELWVPSLASPEHERETITANDNGTEVPMVDISSGSLRQNEETGEYYFANNVQAVKPDFSENLAFLFNYQLNHMYWRYFLWNFAGRQNDYNNQRGEKDYGNWLSGISFIDNKRLGDQSALPEPLGEGNKGHNVFYMLPLILGLIGLLWQAFRGRKGIEQFWVVFFLFFMTGIAIVLYLNQPPAQPRERDYAFAGSFYAFSIWIGLGVAALWSIGQQYLKRQLAKKVSADKKPDGNNVEVEVPKKNTLYVAVAACALGLIVPLQMVSQTWDDHDRSYRYAARDFAINYLESLEPNAIIFCNGDNDTFPLWYAQEVEGVRPDVKIINLSYLQSDWYINQQRLSSYKAAGAPMSITAAEIAYGRRDMVMTGASTDYDTAVPLLKALKAAFSNSVKFNSYGYAELPYATTYISIDKNAARKQGLYDRNDIYPMVDRIDINLDQVTGGQLSLSQLAMLDIIATNAADGWKRPIYWAGTVGSDQYSMFKPYLRATGMVYQLVPYEANQTHDTQRSYDIITKKYRWGGADNSEHTPYIDETAGRMVSFTRMTTFLLATDLVNDAAIFNDMAKAEVAADNKAGENRLKSKALENCKRAVEILDLSVRKLPYKAYPYSFLDYYQVGSTYCKAGEMLNDKKIINRGLGVLKAGMKAYAANVKYAGRMIEKFGSATQVVDGESYSVPYTPDTQLSNENSQILGLFYELAIEYDKYAGAGTSDKILSSVGIKDSSYLKKYYDMAHGTGESVDAAAGVADSAGGYTAEDIYKQVILYIPDITRIQSLDASAYSALDSKDTDADSLFFYLIDLYESVGGDRAVIIEDLKKQGVDVDRSQRVYQQFRQNNPDLFTEQ